MNYSFEQTTIQEFLNEEKGQYLTEKEQLTHEKFPYVVLFRGCYPEHDLAHRFCWINFGPIDGDCNEDGFVYPACPIVLSSLNKNKVMPAHHCHDGRWKTLWVGKTDYDYGYQEYCFAIESEMKSFLLGVELYIATSFANEENQES